MSQEPVNPESPSDEAGIANAAGKGKSRALALVLVAAIAAAAAWGFLQYRSGQAEMAAKNRLNDLGVLVIPDASKKHVAVANFTSPKVAEAFEEAFALIDALPYLETLNLNGTAVTDEHMIAVASLDNLSSLELKETQISDAGVAHLRGLPVQVIDLTQTKITDEALESIATMTDLEIVHLSQTNISGDLAPLAKLPNLQHLVLLDMTVSDAAISSLGAAPRLSRLTLTGTEVSDTALEGLRKAKPGIGIDQ